MARETLNQLRAEIKVLNNKINEQECKIGQLHEAAAQLIDIEAVTRQITANIEENINDTISDAVSVALADEDIDNKIENAIDDALENLTISR